MSCAHLRWVVTGVAMALGLASGTSALGASIHGQVVMPAEHAEVPDGLWRVDNGVIDVLPRTEKPECLVLLVPKSNTAKDGKPETVTVELKGLRLVPAIVAVPMGGTVEFKNDDRVPHSLSAADLLPVRAMPAGATRSELVQRPGIYAITDEEVPHVRGWLLVTENATAARPDEHGAWHADVPDGRYELQLFYKGAYVASRTLDVNGKTTDTTLTVPTPEHP